MFDLKVAATTYTAALRVTNRLHLDRLNLSIDEPGTLEFHQYAATLPALFLEGATIELDYSGTPVFAGEIMRVDPQFGPTGWTIGYQCADLRYVANKIPITNPSDNSGTVTYNLPSDDEDYVASFSGLSVSSILTNIYSGHASALTALGILGPLSSDLLPLTLVPNQPVQFSGPLINAIDQFLDQWAGKYSCTILWDASASSWRLRILDTTAFTPHTLTMGTDPIEPPSISRDSSGSASAVVVRGRSEIEALFGATLDGTLTAGWSAPDQASWKWSDWTNPAGATDFGTLSSVGSTTVTVTSNDTLRAWLANYWNGGFIWVINPTATGILQQEMRVITASASMSAGGHAVITLDRPLVNGGYTNYRMVVAPVNSKADVWRRFNVTSTVALGNLVHKFQPPVRWTSNGVSQLISYPAGNVVKGFVQWPASFQIDYQHNQIVFNEPVVKALNTQPNLDLGGAAVTIPDDVQAAIPYSRGTLSARAPSTGYSGTLYTVAGVQRVATVDAPQWIWAGDQSIYNDYAAMKLDTVKNTVITGNVTYLGLYANALTLGIALNIAGSSYTTGWESINAPVRSVSIAWPPDGPVNFVTSMTVNNRRKQATGDNFYIHPAFTGVAAWEVDQQFGFAQAITGPAQSLQIADNLGMAAQAANDAGSAGLAMGMNPGDVGPQSSMMPDGFGQPLSKAEQAKHQRDRNSNVVKKLLGGLHSRARRLASNHMRGLKRDRKRFAKADAWGERIWGNQPSSPNPYDEYMDQYSDEGGSSASPSGEGASE